MKPIFPIVVSLTLTACVSAGTEVDQTKVATFERGKTTYAEVVAALGTPNADVLSADGSRIIVYTYTQAAARPQSFIPIIGPLVAKADATTQSYQFTFDRTGILKSSTVAKSQATTGTGLAR